MFRSSTKDRVVKFLVRRRSCLISELCYLGKVKMQIKYPVVREIVVVLVHERLVRVVPISLGKRKLYKIFLGGKNGK